MHQHTPIDNSQGKEAQAADASDKLMCAVRSAKPRYNSKMERGCRGERPFLEGVKGSYCEQGNMYRKGFSEGAARLACWPRVHGSEVMLRGEEPGWREDLKSHCCKPQAEECQGQRGKGKKTQDVGCMSGWLWLYPHCLRDLCKGGITPGCPVR